jgi:GTP-binding protein
MYRKITFLASIFACNKCPSDIGTEVAIAGRSNAGKSSLLNRLTGQSKLARISKTPGRTQALNFFLLPNNNRIVDLPGYGYAKTPLNMRHQWGLLINKYLTSRKSLKAVIIVMDIRHPLQDLDLQLIDWLANTQIDIYLVLTKADKFSYGKTQQQLQMVKKQMSDNTAIAGIQTFSSLKKTGISELGIFLDNYLHTPTEL